MSKPLYQALESFFSTISISLIETEGLFKLALEFAQATSPNYEVIRDLAESCAELQDQMAEQASRGVAAVRAAPPDDLLERAIAYLLKAEATHAHFARLYRLMIEAETWRDLPRIRTLVEMGLSLSVEARSTLVPADLLDALRNGEDSA